MESVQVAPEHVLQYVSEEQVQQNIESRGFLTDAATADLERSDLTVHVYEGGFKVWECSLDLCRYLWSNFGGVKKTSVLELGCGAGLPAIVCAQQGASTVVFQDFNECVLRCFTADNIRANGLEEDDYQLISGGWVELKDKIKPHSFELVLTSETIYNEEDYGALHDVIYSSLSDTGICLLAAKFIYFGVGGSVPAFMDFVRKQNKLSVEEVVDIPASVPRKILRLCKL